MGKVCRFEFTGKKVKHFWTDENFDFIGVGLPVDQSPQLHSAPSLLQGLLHHLPSAEALVHTIF